MKNFPVLNSIDGQYVSKDEVLALIGVQVAKEIKRLEHKVDKKPSFMTLLNQIKSVDRKVDDKTVQLTGIQS